MKFLPTDPELEALSIIHIEIEGDDRELYFCNECGCYHKVDNEHEKEEPEEFFERDELILSSRNFSLLAQELRKNPHASNELTDSELITQAIDIESTNLMISRSEALDNLIEFIHYMDDPNPRYLPYI